jgi:hypothetical protein
VPTATPEPKEEAPRPKATATPRSTGSSGGPLPIPAGDDGQLRSAAPEKTATPQKEPKEPVPTATPKSKASAVTTKPVATSNPTLKLTPTNSAAGGTGAAAGGGVGKLLTTIGLVGIAAGGSWGFYYFLKPQRD